MDPPNTDTTSLSKFILSCIKFTRKHQGPALSILSHDTRGSATSVGSAHAVSDFEASSYYLGISDDHPLLLYRTGSEKYPFVKPKGSQAYRTSKSVRGVYGTQLNAIWSTVGPLVRNLIKTQKIRYTSIDVARFITHETDEKNVPGPVVIWIGVYPGSTTADTAYDVSKNIFGLLESYEIEGIEVEWRESVIWRAVGPPLLRTVGNSHPTVDVRGALTATLGVPIATAERPDAQGSVSFFFHEGRDNQGNISDRVLAVTCHHVLFETNKTQNVKYELKGSGAPPKYVRLHGVRRFQRCLDDINVQVGFLAEMADIHERRIIFLEAKEKNKDPEVVEEEEKELRKTHQALADAKEVIEDLWTFYTNTVKDWSDSESRNIGTIDYSPPISFGIGDEKFTEDWGAFALHKDRWKSVFNGNVLNLGTAIPGCKLKYMMCQPFMYPQDRQLRINGIVPKALLASPDLRDENDLPCLLVLKDGNTTGLTVGRATGMESYIRNDDTNEESTELAIYNYDNKSGVFSAKGDSGSLVVDGLGRMVGLLHSGTSRGQLDSVDVSYVTPMHFLWPKIKARYKHADLNCVTWSNA